MKLDIHFINDIQKDDYLFLCSDGISGILNDEELCEIFIKKNKNSKKLEIIKTICEET